MSQRKEVVLFLDEGHYLFQDQEHEEIFAPDRVPTPLSRSFKLVNESKARHFTLFAVTFTPTRVPGFDKWMSKDEKEFNKAMASKISISFSNEQRIFMTLEQLLCDPACQIWAPYAGRASLRPFFKELLGHSIPQGVTMNAMGLLRHFVSFYLHEFAGDPVQTLEIIENYKTAIQESNRSDRKEEDTKKVSVHSCDYTSLDPPDEEDVLFLEIT